MSTADAHAPRRARWMGAVLAAALVAVAFYAIDRTRAAMAGEVYDPYTIVATLRVDYFWRVGLSVFLGTLAAGIWWVAVRDAEAALERLAQTVPFVGAVAAVLSAIWP